MRCACRHGHKRYIIKIVQPYAIINSPSPSYLQVLKLHKTHNTKDRHQSWWLSTKSEMVWNINYLRYLDDSTFRRRLKYCLWFLGCHSYLFLGYTARTLSILEYGRVIREYDPYFNLRATEYLYENGVRKFFTWMDDKSWYPLGTHMSKSLSFL